MQVHYAAANFFGCSIVIWVFLLLWNKKIEPCNILELQQLSGIQGKFDDETIQIKGKVLRRILRRVADFSVSNYLNFFDCEPKWSFQDAFFFAGTIGRWLALVFEFVAK